MTGDEIKELKELVSKATKERRMNTTRPELPAYLLAAITIIGIVVLSMTNHTVPDILNVATIAALGVGGAVTTPGAPKQP